MKWRRKSSARLPSRSCCHKPESARCLAAASPKRLMLPTWLEECGMNLTTENTKNTEMPSSSKHETKTLHEATKAAEGTRNAEFNHREHKDHKEWRVFHRAFEMASCVHSAASCKK